MSGLEKGFIRFLRCALCLALISAGSASAEDGFREIRVAPGLAVADDFIDVLIPFLKGHPETGEGSPGLNLSVEKDRQGFNVDIVLTGYLDDSVYGEHYRGYVIPTSTGQWELLAMSVKTLCARGQSVDGRCTSGSPPPAMFVTPGSSATRPLMCVAVAADDTLNVRAGPGSRHQVMGALAPGNCKVELSDVCEGNWCRITTGSISGWVNTRYLAPAN